MDLLQKLEWSPSTENLDDILRNPRVKLPQVIKLSSDLKFAESKISIKSGQLLNILAKQTFTYVNGILSSSEKDISLPIACPYTVKLTVPQNKLFTSLMDIVEHDPLPKFVEVTQVGCSLDQQCSAGDILKVVLVEKMGDKPTFVHFRKPTGTHFKISCDEKISFKLASNYPSNILICNLFEKSRELPVFVQFSPPKNTPKSYLELGTISINSDAITEVEYVIASTDISGAEYVVVFPLNLNLGFEVNTKLKLANDESYRDLCINFSKVLVEDVVKFLEQPIVLERNSYVVVIKNKKLKKQLRNKSVVKTSPLNLYNEIQVTRENSLNSSPKDMAIQNTNILKQKSSECLKKDKKGRKEKESDEKSSKTHIPEKEVMIENEYLCPQSLPDQATQTTDKQWALLLKKGVKKACTISIGNKTKGNQSIDNTKKEKLTNEQIIYEDCKENLYCELPYESPKVVNEPKLHMFGCSSDQTDQAKINARQSLHPPPLPGNHPHQAKIDMNVISEDVYLDAVDIQNVLTDRADNSSAISTWDIEDVGACLTNLVLDKYKCIFSDSLIDGKLLLELDESVLIDLGLNIFEAFKLRKFVLGWRPKITCSQSNRFSDDPNDWTIEDTAFHMNSIDIPEMAQFCCKNKIDGQLLKDVCINEAIMNLIMLCKDKKLKILKIKNYVIDQWRPKKKSCDIVRRGSVISGDVEFSKTVNSDSSGITNVNTKEKKKDHIDAPHIARVKQQLEKKANNWVEGHKKTRVV